MFKWRLIITWSSRPRERWYLMVIHLEGLHFEKENDSLDWNVYSVSNLCWWYDLRRRRMVTRKTLKELLFSGKLSFQPKRKTMIYWKVENVKRRGRKLENKDFQGDFFRCFSARSESESWFVLSDLYQKSQILDQFKSTRIQRPELFRKAWMWFKWERS